MRWRTEPASQPQKVGFLTNNCGAPKFRGRDTSRVGMFRERMRQTDKTAAFDNRRNNSRIRVQVDGFGPQIARRLVTIRSFRPKYQPL
jgi:hypothetical protein